MESSSVEKLRLRGRRGGRVGICQAALQLCPVFRIIGPITSYGFRLHFPNQLPFDARA